MSTSANTIKNLSKQLEEYRVRERNFIVQVAGYQDMARKLENQNKQLSAKLAQISQMARI